jgi:hypothetical protein
MARSSGPAQQRVVLELQCGQSAADGGNVRALPAHPGHQRPDLRQLLLVLLQALLALLQLASAVRAGVRHLGEQLFVHPLRCVPMLVPAMPRT